MKIAQKDKNGSTGDLAIVTACRRRDVPILRILIDRAVLLNASELHVITHRSNFGMLKSMEPFVHCHDQDQIIPGMTLESLRVRRDLPEMPLAAGWYFQQFLKMSLPEHFPSWRRYLIWDSDTLPLQKIETFDQEGRMIFTEADEWHPPYFESLKKILGVTPRLKKSFISQHVPVDTEILRSISEKIHARIGGNKHWAWKVMENLSEIGNNRFSEYETIAHYSLVHHPEKCVIRRLDWSRHGMRQVKGAFNASNLRDLSNRYAFAAFEAKERPYQRWLFSLYKCLPEYLRRIARREH